MTAEAAAIIWERAGQFDPDGGRFEDWCSTVLFNHAIDLWRKTTRSAVRPAAGGCDSAATMRASPEVDADEASEELMELCRELRAAVDRIAWPASRSVHYFAALLLQLRMEMARRLRRQPSAEATAWRTDFPELVEWLLPWHPDEEAACLRPGWPTLLELWTALGDAIGDPDGRIEGSLVCSTARRLLAPRPQLTPDVWNHWVNRAKRDARHRLSDEAVWARCFSRLLPDVNRRST